MEALLAVILVCFVVNTHTGKAMSGSKEVWRWSEVEDCDGNTYSVPLNHYSIERRLFFLVCEALQLYPAEVRQTSVNRL